MSKHFVYAVIALHLSSASAFAQTPLLAPNEPQLVESQPEASKAVRHNPSSPAEIRESIEDGQDHGDGGLKSGFIQGTHGVTPEDIIESGGTRR